MSVETPKGETSVADADVDFDEKKHRYFVRFASGLRDDMGLLQEHGVAGRSSKRKTGAVGRLRGSGGEYPLLEPDWGNIGRHCLVEAVEADVLAEALGFDAKERERLVKSAFLHDFFKRTEILGMKNAGKDDYLETEERIEGESSDVMREWLVDHGCSEEEARQMARIAEAAGDLYSIKRMEEDDVTFSEELMQYIDGITMNDDIGSVEARVEGNRGKYDLLDKVWEARTGETYCNAQERVIRNIERKIADRLGLSDPSEVPAFIRERIGERVRGIELKTVSG